MKLLEINNLTIWYESLFGDLRAVDRCTLEIEPGTITCLLGINGAGKTTLFRALSGAIKDVDAKITGGEIRFAGAGISARKPHRIVSLGIGHAPQGRHIFYTLSVEDNLYLGAYINRKKTRFKSRMETEKENVYQLFPALKKRRRQKAGTLSGGEQQMLSIGRALMSRPKLLLLDEPFLGMAPMMINAILRSLEQLKQKGLTVFLAEQNAKAALSIADYGFIMDDGHIVGQGDPDRLSASQIIREVYFGEHT